MKHYSVKELVFYALCLSAALILSLVENLMPPLIPVAGVRLGLNNIIVVYLLYSHGFLPAFIVSLLRALLAALLGGNPMTLPYSLCGAAMSLCLMYVVKRYARGAFSIMGVSVIGAFAHNMGQLLAASAMMGGFTIFMYAPVMTLASIPTGLFVGFASSYLGKALRIYGRQST